MATSAAKVVSFAAVDSGSRAWCLQSKMGEVYLDDHGAEFGITPGNTYQLHLFFVERHVINSDFSVETTIADPGTCE